MKKKMEGRDPRNPVGSKSKCDARHITNEEKEARYKGNAKVIYGQALTGSLQKSCRAVKHTCVKKQGKG